MMNPYRFVFIMASIVALALLVVGVILPPLISSNELPLWCIVVLTVLILATLFSVVFLLLQWKD